MDSTAISSFDVAATPTAVRTAVHEVVASRKYTLEKTTEDQPIAFITRQTLLSWKLGVVVTVEPTATGSHVTLTLDGFEGQPQARMDGVKNRKVAKKLVQEIQAAIR